MKPSMALETHRERVHEILSRFRMQNPRIFGSTSRGDDTETSDLDILIDAPAGTSFYDLARLELELEAVLGCKVDIVTAGCLAPDIIKRVEIDSWPMP